MSTTQTTDPIVTGAVAGIRAYFYRAQNFWERHRFLSAMAMGLLLIAVSYLIVVDPAFADSSTSGTQAARDSLKPLRDATYLIHGSDRDIMESIHFLAWNRWTGFTPSSGTYYLTSAGSAAAVVTNTISSLFFVISGFVLRMLGVVATIGLSFEGVEGVMDMVTRNFVAVGALFFPPLRDARNTLCSQGGGGACSQEDAFSDANNILPLVALVLLIGVFVMVVKRNGLPGSRTSRNEAARTGSLFPSVNIRQIAISVGALLAISTMTIAGAAEAEAGVFDDAKYDNPSFQYAGSSQSQLENRKKIPGSPRWVASSIDTFATWVASAMGSATEFTSIILTGQSMKTGPSVGGACSDYIGTLHMVFQNGTEKNTRDDFLVALDELALNSYFRLIVNSSYGDINDTEYSGAGNAWCHALESDSGISGAEHMLITRMSLAINDQSDTSGELMSPLTSSASMVKYPLAYSIDRNLADMVSGDTVRTFAGLKSMENMWGPYTTPQTSNQAKFYFAACNTSYANPELLDSWGQVITADAIKVGPATMEDDEGNVIVVPIGGTVQEKIYLEGSDTIGTIDHHLRTGGAVDSDEKGAIKAERVSKDIGICGGIPLGLYMRNPQVEEAPEAIGFWKYVTDRTLDSTIGKIPFVASDRVEKTAARVEKRNQENLSWASTDNYSRSVADSVMVSTDGIAENFNMLGDGSNSLYARVAKVKAVDISILDEGREIDGNEIAVSPVSLYNYYNNFQGDFDQLKLEEASIRSNGVAARAAATAETKSTIAGATNLAGNILIFSNPILGIGLKVGGHYLDKSGQENLKNVTEESLKIDSPELDAIIQAAVSGFTPGGLSISNNLNWREPDVEFLGLGIKKMSSASPLFVNAIDSGPYDYYNAVSGGNTPATFISSVFSLILAITLAYGLFPLIVGMVLSKLLAILAWFAFPFILMINVWPSPKFRSLLKLAIYSILWSYFSVVVFLGILKITTMLVIVFTTIVYNPTHSSIIQVVEIMIAILSSFAIVTAILKNYLKIDLTSLKGAITGAAMVSGTALMDSLGRSTGILKEGETGDLDDIQGSFKNMAKGVKDKFTSPDASKQEAAEAQESTEKVLEHQNEEKDFDKADAEEDRAVEREEGEKENETANAIAASLQSEGTEGPGAKSSEEVADEASQIAGQIDGAGVSSVDEMPLNAAEAFRENSPDEVVGAIDLSTPEERDEITSAFSDSELLSGGTEVPLDSGLTQHSYDPLSGKAIPVQDAHTAEDGNASLSGDNAFERALMESGSFSPEEKQLLGQASTFSSELNSQRDASTLDIPPEALSWMEGNSEALQSLLSSVGVNPVNTKNGAFAGAASTNDPMSSEDITSLSHGAGFIKDSPVIESSPSFTDPEMAESVLTKDIGTHESLENIADLLSSQSQYVVEGDGATDPYSFGDLRGDIDGTVGKAVRRVRGT